MIFIVKVCRTDIPHNLTHMAIYTSQCTGTAALLLQIVFLFAKHVLSMGCCLTH